MMKCMAYSECKLKIEKAKIDDIKSYLPIKLSITLQGSLCPRCTVFREQLKKYIRKAEKKFKLKEAKNG